jgi:hypothetical protein
MINGDDIKFGPYIDDTELKWPEFNRDTALMVLKDISKHMYSSNDLFGTKTLVINRTEKETKND